VLNKSTIFNCFRNIGYKGKRGELVEKKREYSLLYFISIFNNSTPRVFSIISKTTALIINYNALIIGGWMASYPRVRTTPNHPLSKNQTPNLIQIYP
jgi:hypothetical protein